MNLTGIKKNIKKYFTPVYMLAAAVFVCWFFYKTRDSIVVYFKNFTAGYLILGAILAALFYFFQFKAFVVIQSKNAQINPRSVATVNWAYAYLYGLIGHYIPGKVSVVLGRIMVLGNWGISKEAAILSVLYETGIAVALSFAMGLPLIFITSIPGFSNLYLQLGLTLIIFLGLAVLIFTPLFQKGTGLLLRLFKLSRPAQNIFLGKKVLFKAALRYFISNICLIFSFYFFCRSITTLPFNITAIYIVGGGMVFAVALGIAALFAPSGLGVREAGAVYFTSVATNLIPLEIALLIVVCYRFMIAIVELSLFFSIAFFYKRYAKNPLP